MPEWKSESLDKLCAALATAQGSFETIGRNREVTVKTQNSGTYKFKYAPLDEILNAVRPALSKHGLSVSQLICGETLRTTLLHASGQWIASDMTMPPRPAKMQELGSMLTYLRRYALVAMLGVASEEDDDANAHDGNDYNYQPPPRTYAPPRGKPMQVVEPEAHHPADVEMVSGDGMPSDLKRVLDAIAKAETPLDLAAAAALGAELEESLKADARAAYKARLAVINGGKK